MFNTHQAHPPRSKSPTLVLREFSFHCKLDLEFSSSKVVPFYPSVTSCSFMLRVSSFLTSQVSSLHRFNNLPIPSHDVATHPSVQSCSQEMS